MAVEAVIGEPIEEFPSHRSVVCAILKDAVLYVRDRRSRVAGMPLAGSKVICGLISITAGWDSNQGADNRTTAFETAL